MTCKPQNQSAPRAAKAPEAATILGISRRFLAQLTKEGKIACHRYGPRTVVYEIEELERFKQTTRVGTKNGN